MLDILIEWLHRLSTTVKQPALNEAILPLLMPTTVLEQLQKPLLTGRTLQMVPHSIEHEWAAM
jgi:hypothetical protein